MKKKYPEIKPKLVKDNKGKTVSVALDYKVYQSVINEIDELKKELFKKKPKKIKK